VKTHLIFLDLKKYRNCSLFANQQFLSHRKNKNFFCAQKSIGFFGFSLSTRKLKTENKRERLKRKLLSCLFRDMKGGIKKYRLTANRGKTL